MTIFTVFPNDHLIAMKGTVGGNVGYMGGGEGRGREKCSNTYLIVITTRLKGF